MIMERKIGEIFEYNGEWYQCVEGRCKDCYFSEKRFLCKQFITKGFCTHGIIFKKLEKVGEPFFVNIQGNNVLQQRHKLYEPMVTLEGYWYRIDGNFINIEIKQNTEDMEEDNNTKHSNLENIGKNLKPFDLQAAKSGKPVCTRSGKPVRIICFDVKGAKHPIIALVKEDGYERVCSYIPDGRRFEEEKEWSDDLMMIPEKKEGWVNLYRDEESKRVYCGEFIFSEREKAEKHYECNDTKVATVPINWEE